MLCMGKKMRLGYFQGKRPQETYPVLGGTDVAVACARSFLPVCCHLQWEQSAGPDGDDVSERRGALALITVRTMH